MVTSIWRAERGACHLVANAIHDGHTAREEVAEHLALDEVDRLREEDPFTSAWAAVAATRVVGTRLRFEVDAPLVQAIKDAPLPTTPGIVEELNRL